MINILQDCVTFVSDLLQMLVQGYFILLIFNKKVKWRRFIVFALLTGLATTLPHAIQHKYIPFISISIYILVMVFSLRFILEFKYIHSILATCIMFLLTGAINYIGMGLLKISLQENFNMEVWTKSFPHYFIMRNIGALLCIVAIVMIYYLKIKINISEDINKKRTVGLIVNSLIVVILIIPNMLFFASIEIKIPNEIIIFNAVSLLVLLALSINSTIKSEELELMRQEVEYQKLYIQTLNDLIDGLRGFKHDFNNTIQVLGGYLALDDMDGLKKYHLQIQSECRKLNNIAPLNSYLKGNPAIYGLLLSKLSYSEIKDITFNINILSEINIRNIKTYDFCKILGVLLDNALEASVESEEKYVELSIAEKPDKTALVINICNTFSGVVDTEIIFTSGYTTKPGHIGFGLWEVKRILSRYKNCMLKTVVDGNIFTQNINMLY